MNGVEAVRSTSLFLGVDLGWTTGATGLATVDDTGRLTASGRVQTDGEIVGWIAAQPGRVVVAAVDAPLIVPNETGQRVPERLIGRAFGGFGASAHTANRARFPGGDTRAMRLAQRFGWAVDPRMPTGGDVSVCIEVYPHPALVGLFELPYRLDYKKGNDQRRAPGFRLFVQHLESIPELVLAGSPRWEHLKHVLASPRPGDLTRVEDELDAIVCAHLAWLWHHRRSTLEVFGDVEVGYIVAPPPPLHRPQQPERRGAGASVPAPGRFERVGRGRPTGYSAGTGEQRCEPDVRSAFSDCTLPVGQPSVAGCRCGCGEQVGRSALYRPGHDARHASQVGRAMIEARAEDPVLLAALPSEALRAKARAMLHRSASRGPLQPRGTVVRRSSPQGMPAVESEALPVPPEDSSEQRGAAAVMLAALGERLGVALAPARFHLPDGSVVEVDGVAADPAVLVEAWAHQGPIEPAQRNEVLAAAFKLVHVASQLPVAHRKVLCLSDQEAARPFLERSWYAKALRSMEVEVEVVPLGEEWRERVLNASARLYR